tara:strand:- start:615 stop:1202 length:588 start_codon:yes stop_codon:yes gene_type:complete
MIVNTTTGRLAPVQSIRRANPNVSIPSSPDDATLAMLGYARIQPTTQPEGDVVTEGQPEQRDGAWYQTWEVREFTVEELAEREQQQREQLAQQIADRRWQAETGGITLNGMHIDTGRDSQALITGATVQAMLDPAYSLRWKTSTGFVDLTAEQIIAVATAARGHVQNCFNREAELLNEVENGTFEYSMLEIGWPE